jgi:hypothetical protein
MNEWEPPYPWLNQPPTIGDLQFDVLAMVPLFVVGLVLGLIIVLVVLWWESSSE